VDECKPLGAGGRGLGHGARCTRQYPGGGAATLPPIESGMVLKVGRCKLTPG
jgi:hypothetical protein